MNDEKIPELSQSEVILALGEAENSERKRAHKILHAEGSTFNQVFNFMLYESYMQPHMHPGEEKIEFMYLLQGEFKLIYFDNDGRIVSNKIYNPSEEYPIKIPAYTWHTYVMMTREVVTYETMMGRYEPSTWKKMAKWAPQESSTEAAQYLKRLRSSS